LEKENIILQKQKLDSHFNSVRKWPKSNSIQFIKKSKKIKSKDIKNKPNSNNSKPNSNNNKSF